MEKNNLKIQRIYIAIAVLCLIGSAVFIFLPNPDDSFTNLIIAFAFLVVAFIVLRLQSNLAKKAKANDNKVKLQNYLAAHCDEPKNIFDYVLIDFKEGKLMSALVDKTPNLEKGGIYENGEEFAIGLEVKGKVYTVVEIEPFVTKVNYDGKKEIIIDYSKENFEETSQLYDKIIDLINNPILDDENKSNPE